MFARMLFVLPANITQADSGKVFLVRIVSMGVGLIRSTSPSRVHENPVDTDTRPAREAD